MITTLGPLLVIALTGFLTVVSFVPSLREPAEDEWTDAGEQKDRDENEDSDTDRDTDTDALFAFDRRAIWRTVDQLPEIKQELEDWDPELRNRVQGFRRLADRFDDRCGADFFSHADFDVLVTPCQRLSNHRGMHAEVLQREDIAEMRDGLAQVGARYGLAGH